LWIALAAAGQTSIKPCNFCALSETIRVMNGLLNLFSIARRWAPDAVDTRAAGF
jgi:hypothetical protein